VGWSASATSGADGASTEASLAASGTQRPGVAALAENARPEAHVAVDTGAAQDPSTQREPATPSHARSPPARSHR
jgi:hypothetical protein